MVNASEFSLEVECRVYDMGGGVEINEESVVIPGDFCGWVSLSSHDLDLTDEDVFKLLDVAHAQKSFVREFLELHNRQTGSLQELGIEGDVEFDVDDVWVRSHVSKEYLRDVLGEMEANRMLVESLKKFDSEVEIREY